MSRSRQGKGRLPLDLGGRVRKMSGCEAHGACGVFMTSASSPVPSLLSCQWARLCSMSQSARRLFLLPLHL